MDSDDEDPLKGINFSQVSAVASDDDDTNGFSNLADVMNNSQPQPEPDSSSDNDSSSSSSAGSASESSGAQSSTSQSSAPSVSASASSSSNVPKSAPESSSAIDYSATSIQEAKARGDSKTEQKLVQHFVENFKHIQERTAKKYLTQDLKLRISKRFVDWSAKNIQKTQIKKGQIPFDLDDLKNDVLAIGYMKIYKAKMAHKIDGADDQPKDVKAVMDTLDSGNGLAIIKCMGKYPLFAEQGLKDLMSADKDDDKDSDKK